MKPSIHQEPVVRVPISSAPPPNIKRSSQPDSSGNSTRKSERCKVLRRMNKVGRKADNFAHGVQEHVKMGPKITDTVKGKLSLGARILQVGGMEKVFMQLFGVREGEKLLKACQCYLSTTAGPVAGLLFISTHKVAFYSDRSIKISPPNGEKNRLHYKVMIPLEKIRRVNQSENANKPSQKYIDIATVDDFDFWFMGFLYHEKAFRCLQQAISGSLNEGKIEV
ncbi:hypothetical protein L6164_020915 [Bauhinia variegata]|uniref:Uncharacterized protein n=1 Tax=Bauhinia variegata TaxID=167791 RepID=A0ACB9MXD6_BAUVA|nr:hypothetical protein L6164_020915 [Bauhinia variegata]